ncbi:unnamed protein product [Lactuca virosa]|uniref:AB hydrolase-1 domain-containing protein n=1 Tax=Lactuca virosa TaxID=75947 RepID=A0AAU9NW21_9ASTR|nr:unnamed protein product [Lactuca virosa]
MAGEVKRKISASSARSHTRKSKSESSSSFPSDSSAILPNRSVCVPMNEYCQLGFPSIKILKHITSVVFIIGFLAWAYQSACPPQPKKLGSPDGLPITTPRIKLRDGRHLSYKEYGVPKAVAKYKIIYVHGFDSIKYYAVIATSASPALIEELGIHIVSFDRPGYGESDPNPNQTLKSSALDIEELGDQLELGSKFYVSRSSLIAPVVNYWWPSLPLKLSQEAYSKQFIQDQWSVRVAHHLPSLTYWWNTQKLFPSYKAIAHSPDILSHQDMELIPKFTAGRGPIEGQVRQQGEYESIHRDLNIGFGTWEFDPMDIENPFPNNEGSVDIWMGDDDKIVPVTLQRYIAQQLPWIRYHELKGAGHMFPYADGISDAILKELLLGKI